MMCSFFSVVSEAVPGAVGVSDQRGRDEMSGAAVETGAWMSRSANMPKPVDRCRVAALGSKRPPEEALVELGGAAVRIAVNGVGIAGL